EPHTNTSAPPALSVRARFAVSVVTCRHAATRVPRSGRSLANRARIVRSTGMLRSDHSMRMRPCRASARSLTWPATAWPFPAAPPPARPAAPAAVVRPGPVPDRSRGPRRADRRARADRTVIAVDTGILALALNRWAPEHARASRLVEGLANGEAPWAVTWPALHELVGRVTHRHDVARPLAPRDACGFVEELLASPSLRPLGPTARHAAVLRDVLESLGD